MDGFLISYIVIPLLIFISRVVDVSLGTLRIILISKGYRWLAPVIGFFEILIWILAIGKLMSNMDNWVYYVAYALGFATGSYVGIWIEERIALGYCMIRIITSKEADTLYDKLIELSYHVTHVDAKSNSGDVGLVYVVSRRHDIPSIIQMIKKYNPKAYYIVEDIRHINKDAYFPHVMKPKKRRGIISLRKAK